MPRATDLFDFSIGFHVMYTGRAYIGANQETLVSGRQADPGVKPQAASNRTSQRLC